MCKQACEYRHETRKLAPRPDEYVSTGTEARKVSDNQHKESSQVKENRKTESLNLFLLVLYSNCCIYGNIKCLYNIKCLILKNVYSIWRNDSTVKLKHEIILWPLC